jgi:hypothetical protein
MLRNRLFMRVFAWINKTGWVQKHRPHFAAGIDFSGGSWYTVSVPATGEGGIDLVLRRLYRVRHDP